MLSRLKAVLTAVCLGVLFLLPAACAPVYPDVNTGRPRNTLFSLGEEIPIYDGDTGDKLASLTVAELVVLSEEPFTLTRKAGTDDDGNPVEVSTTYRLLVQVFYVFVPADGVEKTVSDTNFALYDGSGKKGKLDPPIESEPEAKKGMRSFVAGLREAAGPLRVEFSYASYQLPCAIVSAALPPLSGPAGTQNGFSAMQGTGTSPAQESETAVLGSSSGETAGSRAAPSSAVQPGRASAPPVLLLFLCGVIAVLLTACVLLTVLLYRKNQ